MTKVATIACLTGKREGGGGLQPGKPGGCFHREHLLVVVLLVDQPFPAYQRGHLRHGCAPTRLSHRMLLVPEQERRCSGIPSRYRTLHPHEQEPPGDQLEGAV